MGVVDEFEAMVAIVRTATSPFERPDRLPKAIAALVPWGTNPAGLAASAAARYPDRVAVADDDRAVTYREMWRRILAIRGGLHRRDIGVGDRVGVMMRNHVGFVEALLAVAATGAETVLFNTGFGAGQVADVAASQAIDCLIHDIEFAPIVDSLDVTRIDEAELDELARGRPQRLPNRRPGAIVILTSGTTGRPKGAVRGSKATTLTGVGAVLERVPLRLGDVQYLAAPMFHAWGFSNVLLGLARAATTIVSRRFEPVAARHAIDDHRARVLVAVPVMLHRLLEADDSPMPSVEVIATSGSAIGRGLVQRTLTNYGAVLYNLYGSTEVAVATIATPTELAQHPDTAGRPALGVTVDILDEAGDPLREGQIGRVFVGSGSRFDGYTDGGGKEERGGLLSTGDLGVMRDGLLFVEGREDDMIVSGGENVYPTEVESLLSTHPAIAEVAVVGVPDDEFGQVMAAFVVAVPGARLDAQQVRRHVSTELARHKTPRHVHLVDSLPRNETGKVLRGELTASAPIR